MTEAAAAERHEFQAEVSKLLHMMVHSVYSEQEIFLRELISNASDACDKLRYEAITDPSLTSGGEDFEIRVAVDKEAKTLTIADNGIGMSHDELVDNLGTIARSGTGRFLESMEKGGEADLSLIGQFGVGFYSAFMVASEVNVYSRRAGTGDVWHWSSDGTGSFTLETVDAYEGLVGGRGTAVVLSIKDDATDYLEQLRLSQIVKTYSDHVAFPINFVEAGSDAEAEMLNSASALWTRSKSEITEEQYKEFYHHVGHGFDEPWATIHYQAEGRISYNVLLFVPSEQPFDLFDPKRNQRVKLYVNRVFITDDAPLLPGYLRFMRGVVDSADMPLNLSREMLQNNPIVTSIRNALTKRVLNELTKKADKEPEAFASFWEKFGAVIKEGLYEDFERRDELLKLVRFKSTTHDMRSLADYVADMKEGQDTIYYLTGMDPAAIAKSPQLEGFRSRGIEVLLLSDSVDGFWINNIQEFDGKKLVSAKRGASDIDKFDEDKSEDDDRQEGADTGTLVSFMKEILKDEVEDVRASSRLTDSPVCLVAGDQALDMEMEKILAQHNQLSGLSKRVLEINPKNGMIAALASKASSGDEAALIEDAAYLLLDQARILEGDPVIDASAFAKRMGSVLQRALS